MIVRRPEMRLKLASILAKLMNLPAPNPDEPREGEVVPPVPDQDQSPDNLLYGFRVAGRRQESSSR